MKTYIPPFDAYVPGMLYLFGSRKDAPIIAFPNTPEMRKFHYPTGNRGFNWKLVDGTTKETIASGK